MQTEQISACLLLFFFLLSIFKYSLRNFPVYSNTLLRSG